MMAESQANLLSINSKLNWKRMSSYQKMQFTNKIKSRAAVMLIQATQYIENKNYRKAKQSLIYVADSCMCIEEKDAQVEKWIQISCTYIALLYRNQQKKIKSQTKIQKNNIQNLTNVLTLRYNKFSSQFQLQQQEQRYNYKEVLQQVSKINSILFQYQNVGNNHSLLVMLSFYWLPFLLILILLVIVFSFLGIHNLFQTFGPSSSNLAMQIPSIVLGGLLILPMILIFLKTPDQRNNLFFQKKLGQQIKFINESCKARGKQIVFLKPHEGQINVKLGNSAISRLSTKKNQLHNQCETQTPEHQFMDKMQGLKRQISNSATQKVDADHQNNMSIKQFDH